eukprot:scaffold536_cov409-Prasinococcus_capsulatus_cf.AAC.3
MSIWRLPPHPADRCARSFETACGTLQLFKPPRGAKRRRVWSLVHIVCGRLAAIFGVVNTFLGLNRQGGPPRSLRDAWWSRG